MWGIANGDRPIGAATFCLSYPLSFCSGEDSLFRRQWGKCREREQRRAERISASIFQGHYTLLSFTLPLTETHRRSKSRRSSGRRRGFSPRRSFLSTATSR